MGLDMYFEARKNKWKSFSHWDAEKGGIDETDYPADLSVLADYIADRNFKAVDTEISYQIGYFRKFNALHNYIVQHFAEGRDECQKIRLTDDKIKTLREVCSQVKEDHKKAAELLPSASGFFFGSQEYDEYYFDVVDEAINLFNLILDNVNFDEYEITYQASW